jgi:hypothetical protein
MTKYSVVFNYFNLVSLQFKAHFAVLGEWQRMQPGQTPTAR